MSLAGCGRCPASSARRSIFGVVSTLEALERDGKTGSRFDVWKTLTTARHSGAVAAEVPLKCQRAGVAAGRDAVKLWHDTIKTNIGKVGFWAARRDLCRTRAADTAQLAELIDRHGPMPQDLVVVELMDRLRVRIADAKDVAAAVKVTHRKADPVKERRYCDTKLAAASRRCSTHLASGTRKFFRSRKDLERNPRHRHRTSVRESRQIVCPGGGCWDLFDVSPVWGQRNPRKPSGVPMPRLWLGRQRRLQRSTQRRPPNLHPSLNRLGAEKPGGRDNVSGCHS